MTTTDPLVSGDNASTGIAGSPKYINTAYNGPLAMTTAGTASSYFALGHADVTTNYVRAYVYASNTGTTIAISAAARNTDLTAGNFLAQLGLDANRRVQIYERSSSGTNPVTVVGTTQVPLNTWCRLELKTSVQAGVGYTSEWRLFVDPASTTPTESGTRSQISQPTISWLRGGYAGKTQNIAPQTIIDELAVSDVGWIGPIVTLSEGPVLSASLNASNQPVLTWTEPPGAVNYDVLARLTPTGGATQVATAITATTFTDSVLAGGATRYYEVIANNADGSLYFGSNQVSVTRAAAGHGQMVGVPL